MYDVSQVMDSLTKQNICKVNTSLDSDQLHHWLVSACLLGLNYSKSIFLSKLLWAMAILLYFLSPTFHGELYVSNWKHECCRRQQVVFHLMTFNSFLYYFVFKMFCD